MDKAMTELRGAVRQRVLDAINDCGREKLQCRQTGADEATDAIMALFAGGSGEVSEEAVEAARIAFQRARDDVHHIWNAMRVALAAAYAIDRPAPVVDRYVESRLEKQREADAFHMGIDRPAPVVVRELEWTWEQIAPDLWRTSTPSGRYFKRRLRDAKNAGQWWWAGNTGDKEHCPFDQIDAACQADYTRRILSAVNAASEVQVRADERQRLAKRAHENAHDPNWQENLDGCQCLSRSDWLEVEAFIRTQEGGK